MTSTGFSSPCHAGTKRQQTLAFTKCSLEAGEDGRAAGACHSESRVVFKRGPRSNQVESNLFPGQKAELGLGGVALKAWSSW